jgi:hypothetical protein
LPYAIWLIVQVIQWAALLIAASIAVRIATAIVLARRPPPPEKRRRDVRWLIGLLIMLPLGMALVHCQIGGFYGFRDPLGHDWSFDAHGWPLSQPNSLMEQVNGGAGSAAIYLTALAVDLVCSLLLLIALRVVIDRWLAAWDAPRRWPALGREAAAWCLALGMVLFCERFAARPVNLPGSELIVYSTVIYEPTEVRAGMLLGLASAALLTGVGIVRAAQAFGRLREEGVI